jgi:tetratricopeptide (TPR) repeat protein
LSPFGYHLVNILLHATAVLLLWRVLLRLQVPGAWLAAAMFAVHPVMVESVAWVTERKNVLSMSLVLGSILCYLRFAFPEIRASRETREAKPTAWYAASLVLFALALTAKTVVVTLPPVLLVIQWWKRGKIERRDWLAVAPYFLLSIALGSITTWMETYHLGARGKEWSLTPLERLLLAGRALWFYATTLVWPHPLAFFYPRFTIDTHAWWQYLFPIAAIAVPAVLWLLRDRISRGPLAAVLIYTGVLMPMLGFFNIYYAMYAQVSDHFQYHACVALFALAAAGISAAAARLHPSNRAIGSAAIAALLIVLAAISFRQTYIYHDLETLYRDTIAKNPRGTIAYSNLGVYLNAQGQNDEAIALAREVLALDPDDPIGHANLSFFLLTHGNRYGLQPDELDEIIDHLRRALSTAQDAWGTIPNEARIRTQLATALLRQGTSDGVKPEKIAEVIEQSSAALKVEPTYVDAELNLALALATIGRAAEAVAHAQRALDLDPQNAEPLHRTLGPALSAEAHNARAGAFAAQGAWREAADEYSAAVALRPEFDRALNNLGVMMMKLGDTERAIHYFQEAVRQNPQYTEAQANLERAQRSQSEPATPH